MSDHQALAQLLRDCEAAHRLAFPKLSGRDDAWPAWYSHWLMSRITKYITADGEELAAVLEALDGEHLNTPGAAPWPEFCAAQLVERFG